ncbi:amino acid adenylation domain-containing protein [Acetobacter farinalis]|uniref:Amino acid adenylation domain-containing protein n=1 Tax=Acetobacter farinalis TaxID=1260984 RepID=A0ABT3Q761_9PROT|nr:amino acid adenylation domain-containing protein [Acetobacter farinalis]
MSGTPLPLTTAQRGVWMGCLLQTQEGTFNIAEAVEIHGPVEPGLFRQALEQVAQEAETTRVSIRMGVRGPEQHILPQLRCPLPYLDVSQNPDPDASAQDWMMQRVMAPVDLAEDPLWYSALLKLSAERFVWFHCCHHIAMDGFSGGLVVARVAELYSALVEGRQPEPSPFLPLRQLIEQEAAYRESARREADLHYWRDSLRAPPPPITLASPLHVARGVAAQVQKLGFITRNWTIPPAMATQMEQIGKAGGVTLPQMLTALLTLYLFRMTGQEDLTVGMPVTGRTDREMRRVPGMAANAVVLRLAPAQTLPFSDLLAQVRRSMRGALRHQGFRYEDLRRILGFHDTQAHLSRIGINIEPFDYHLSFGGHPARNRNLSNGAMEDLTIFVFDRQDGQGLSLALYANPALYDGADLERHLARLVRLMQAVLEDPTQTLGAYPVFSETERAVLLADEARTARRWETQDCKTDLARHAARTPRATAIVDALGTVTYAELSVAVRSLAKRLRGMEIGAGDIVALMLPRDRRQVIAMLATASVGAAWLSLDVAGPRERNATIIANAKPALFLTEAVLPTGLPDGAATLGLTAEGLPATLYGQPAGQRAAGVPAGTAYVIYTSGTTGAPKGVVVSWRSLTNLLCAMKDALSFGSGECWLSVTSVTFDISILELLLPLKTGARLVIARRETVLDPALLAEALRHHGVTLMQATPTLWQMLVGAGLGASLRQVRVLSGGEPLPAVLARHLLACARAVYNVYGPTETTIWSSFQGVEEENCREGAVVPAGRPLANTQFYCLDPSGALLAPGMPGQLAIGGEGVASGYLHRPELTQAVFRPDPFTARPEARLYLTGDRAVRQADGTLTVLGRMDAQIKIRGVRAEPAEIEGALVRLPGVAQAAVRVWERPHGPVLAAYLVLAAPQDAAGSAGLAENDLVLFREHLQAMLPVQMVPSCFVVLESLPLTASGKLDRKALPEPVSDECSAERAEPRTAEEHILVALWSDILGIKNIGLNDNFFDLGGDSLGAVHFVTGLAEKGYDLPVAALFGAPTIARLAPLLHQAQSLENILLETLLPLRPEGAGQPVFCLHPILGVSLSFSSLLPFIPEDRPVYGLQNAGLMQGADAPGTLQALAALYLEQIRAVQPEGPYTVVGWSMGGLVAHAVCAALQKEGEQRVTLVMLDSYPLLSEPGAAQRSLTDQELIMQAIPLLGIEFSETLPQTLDALADQIVSEMMQGDLVIPAEFGDVAALCAQLRSVVERNLHLMRTWKPDPVNADLLFLRATQRGAGLVRDDPAVWADYVKGHLVVQDVPCTHGAMLHPEHARQIAGSVLAFEARAEAVEVTAQAAASPPSV